MNPFKHKTPKNKLLTRFNISMATRPETAIAHRLNFSKQGDQNTARYRNHINFLECRIEQQQATIEKMEYQLQASLNVQNKLKAHIMRLQKNSKNMLQNLYQAENRIQQLEEANNNQMLHQSIQKIQHELSMSQVRKRNRTLEDLQNPQKSTTRSQINKKSMKTSQRFSMESQEPSFKLAGLMNFFRMSSQVYSVNIKPSTEGKNQKWQKQNSQKISKLQMAIYSLKKQLREHENSAEQKLTALLQQQNKKFQEKIKQKQSKISYLIQKLEGKDMQIIEIEEKYGKQLGEAEQIVVSLNDNIKEIVAKKQEQVDEAYAEAERYLKRMKELNDANHRANQEIQQLTQNIQSLENNIAKLENQIVGMRAQNEELRESLMKKQDELLQSQPVDDKPLFSLVQDDTMSQIENSYKEQLSTMASQLKKKDALLQEQSQKSAFLLGKIEKLQSLNFQISKKQNNLHESLEKAMKEAAQLQDAKTISQRELNRLTSTIRHLEGETAEKEYLLANLTEQMVAIKDKLVVEKIDGQCQVEPIQNKQLLTKAEPQLNLEQLQQHFTMILKQKEEEYNSLHAQLQKQRSMCQHLQKEIEKYNSQICRRELQIEQANRKISELNEVISKFESQIEEYKYEITGLKKNVSDLEQKQAFFQDYIQQIKAAEA